MPRLTDKNDSNAPPSRPRMERICAGRSDAADIPETLWFAPDLTLVVQDVPVARRAPNLTGGVQRRLGGSGQKPGSNEEGVFPRGAAITNDLPTGVDAEAWLNGSQV